MKEKLNLSVGILSWGSPNTIINTLKSYGTSKLLENVNDVVIFFQEASNFDRELSKFFDIRAIMSETNIGIGKALTALCEASTCDNVILLENDWVNIENPYVTYEELKKGIDILDSKKADVVKYRHRMYPGEPLYTRQYAGNELSSPKHLFDCVHWCVNPDEKFPEYIKKDEESGYYLCNSAYANQTNNPCMYKKDFYLKNISPFAGEGVDLEGKIDEWWRKQDFTVAHGKGLFTHYRMDR